MSQPQSTAPAGPPYKRSFKNYLIDRNFQLKYTSFLVGTAMLLSLALGVLLWRASSEVIEEGKKTVERGQLVILQSRRVTQVVAMNIAKEYKDDPELAKTFGEEAAKDEQKLKDEQDRLVRDAVFLETQQRELLAGLILALGLLVVGVGVLGIVFTHKVAGPIFKMKRLLREVGGGKLVVRERLRKGDELQHFFEVFENMVTELRRRQEAEIARVDKILEKLSDAPVSHRGMKEFDDDGVEMLRQLRREMQDQLEADPDRLPREAGSPDARLASLARRSGRLPSARRRACPDARAWASPRHRRGAARRWFRRHPTLGRAATTRRLKGAARRSDAKARPRSANGTVLPLRRAAYPWRRHTSSLVEGQPVRSASSVLRLGRRPYAREGSSTAGTHILARERHAAYAREGTRR